MGVELEPAERATLAGICWAGFDGRTFAVTPLQQALAHVSAQLGRKVRLSDVVFSAVDAVELRLRTQQLVEAVYPASQHAARMREWVEECQPLVAVYLPPGVAEVAAPKRRGRAGMADAGKVLASQGVEEGQVAVVEPVVGSVSAPMAQARAFSPQE